MRAALLLLLAAPLAAQPEPCSAVVRAEACASHRPPPLAAPASSAGWGEENVPVWHRRYGVAETSRARPLVGTAGERSRAAVSNDDAWRWADDDWTGRDKALHFGASALLTLSGQYVLVQKLHATDGEAAPFSSGAALAVGLAKEVHDARRPAGSGFSLKDLAWDAAGVAAALVVVAL